MESKFLRTQAFVLRRTNYGETDRIVNFLTPQGKVVAIAKGVRKEKAKLAGNIELFCLTDITIHLAQGNTERLGVLTGAKMIKNYPAIATDLTALELASKVLKQVSYAAENVKNRIFFDLTQQVFEALENKIDTQLVEIWFAINFAGATGETLNFYRDTTGKKLDETGHYFWDSIEKSFRPDPKGNITAREIKLARLLSTNKLATAARVQNLDQILPALAVIAFD